MQQGFGFGCAVEVPAFRPQQKVRHEACAGCDVLSQLHELFGQQSKPAERVACRQHQEQRGENASDTPRIKLDEAEGSLSQIFQEYGGYEKAGNDKENINAGEAARDQTRDCMKSHDGQHGQRAKPVNIGPVGWMREIPVFLHDLVTGLPLSDFEHIRFPEALRVGILT